MDFWNVYEKARVKVGFGDQRLYITSRERINQSLSTVERYGFVLGMNQGVVRRFSDEYRYIIVKNLTYDLLLSFYNVNTTYTYLIRFSDILGDSFVRNFREELRKLKKTEKLNFEMRLIGSQNKKTDLLESVERLRVAAKSDVIEVDLFGSEVRHIVFDTKLGMSFNLLLLNRIYRPHELANTQTQEDFEKTKSELKFI